MAWSEGMVGGAGGWSVECRSREVMIAGGAFLLNGEVRMRENARLRRRRRRTYQRPAHTCLRSGLAGCAAHSRHRHAISLPDGDERTRFAEEVFRYRNMTLQPRTVWKRDRSDGVSRRRQPALCQAEKPGGRIRWQMSSLVADGCRHPIFAGRRGRKWFAECRVTVR